MVNIYIGVVNNYYIVQLVFENHSNKNKEFVTNHSWMNSFITADRYMFTTGGMSYFGCEFNTINQKSRYVKYLLLIIPESYLNKSKKIKCVFVWISEEEYKTKKYDNLINEEKRKQVRKITKESLNDKILIETEINKHFKFELILGQKKKAMKDILTCELGL